MHVSRAFVAGKFSYCFYGFLEKHDDSCKCTACVVRGFFHRSETIMKFSTMTGMHLVQCNEVICSCYKGGNFLSPHEDKAKGKLGFVLNLSRDWLPQFGGNLNFLDDDWIHIRKVVVPKFNNLVLFDLPKGKGVPHFVSHIFPGVSLKRLGIAGWFS
jgi:Rps23 Pro-64 3,4-dihydroxylase Tpa1-like proline 4-hydroxylase